jgi:hypothetical protein
MTDAFNSWKETLLVDKPETWLYRQRTLIRRKFLETQVQFMYAMDSFTVDSVPGKRFCCFAIISQKHGGLDYHAGLAFFRANEYISTTNEVMKL